MRIDHLPFARCNMWNMVANWSERDLERSCHLVVYECIVEWLMFLRNSFMIFSGIQELLIPLKDDRGSDVPATTIGNSIWVGVPLFHPLQSSLLALSE